METSSSAAAEAAAAEAERNGRYGNLRKSLKLALRSLLTACPREDVDRAFPSFTDAEREGLYRLLVHVIKSLHNNIGEELDTICEEAEVAAILDKVDQFVEEQSLDILSTDKTNIEDIKEKITRAKKDEVQYLTSSLEKVEERNNAMRARIECLKKEEDFTATRGINQKLRQWNSEYESYNAT